MAGSSGDRIAKACRFLDRERPERALELIDGEEPTPAVLSLRSVALGLIAEQMGKASEAEDSFDQAFEQRAPLPAVLKQLGRYYKRTGNYARALDLYALLHEVEPRALDEFLADLPNEELARYSPWKLRRELEKEERGGQPRHWFYTDIKAALCTRLGPEEAALAFTEMAGNRFGEARSTRLCGLLDFASSGAADYEELSAARPMRIPPPPTFGEAVSEGFDSHTRTVFFTTIDDAVVSSKSNLILAGERALLDYQGDELDRVPIDLSTDPIVFGVAREAAVDGQRVTASVEHGGTRKPTFESALTLVGVNSFNFGHWLLEFLPRMWIAGDRPGFEEIPVLVDERMPPQNFEALRLFLGPEHPISVVGRGEAVRVERLWTCSTLVYVPLAQMWGTVAEHSPMVGDGALLAEYAARVLPALDPPDSEPAPARIYLARKDSQHRHLENRHAVEGWFAAQGFEIVDFGGLSFSEQLRLVRGAEVIVGPDGSSLMMTMLAGPGTRIGVLDNPYLEDNEWYGLVCEELGQPLLYMIGDVVREDPNYRFRSSYEIDVNELPAFQEALLAR